MTTRPIPIALLLLGLCPLSEAAEPTLRAGADAVDISPTKFPVLVNGGFLQASANQVRDPLFSRALVLDDGATRLAIVVVDSCMMPRELLDQAKQLASQEANIPTDRILISATHTHTAPAAMGALGCAPDATYAESLPTLIAESITRAAARLEPARVGHAAIDDFEHTHCRRWIRRPDKLIVDPFGQPTARANMHPGYQNPDAIGPAGPVDPQLSVLSVQSTDGRPIAVLANYSMHYFGAEAVSADYYGRFAQIFPRLINAGPDFVAMMSQGTSGDQHWMDYAAPKTDMSLDAYAEQVAQVAESAYRSISGYRADASLAMAEATLTLGRRTPDEARLAWARPVLEALGSQPPRNLPEVYAAEALFLHNEPTRELKLQALRIGDIAIATIPDEVYALTGLKLKARSPLESTFVIELANGSEGYIPPPEQHALGGYTTWPARTAALEVQAEPKIVEASLTLLESVSSRARRPDSQPTPPSARAILGAGPVAFYRLGEMDGDRARDASPNGRHATYHPGFARYLDGPPLAGASAINRCVHLAGGHLEVPASDLGDAFTIGLWFWNGLPPDARPTTGDLIAFGDDGPRVSLAGTDGPAGRLALRTADTTAAGTTTLEPKTWHHLALVVHEGKAAIYLDGATGPELATAWTAPTPATLQIGGGPDPSATWEGRIDEIALFDRALNSEELDVLARP